MDSIEYKENLYFFILKRCNMWNYVNIIKYEYVWLVTWQHYRQLPQFIIRITWNVCYDYMHCERNTRSNKFTRLFVRFERWHIQPQVINNSNILRGIIHTTWSRLQQGVYLYWVAFNQRLQAGTEMEYYLSSSSKSEKSSSELFSSLGGNKGSIIFSASAAFATELSPSPSSVKTIGSTGALESKQST